MTRADLGDSAMLVRHLLVTALRDPAALPGMPATQLDLTLRLLRRARLLGRVAYQLGDLGLLADLPPVAADQLASALTFAEARARAAQWELDRLAWALREVPEVPVVALKGCAYLLSDTPNVAGRSFADVDLLVPETDLPAVELALRGHGWSGKELTPYDDMYYRRWTHELPAMTHAERTVEVDLHHNILMRTARLKPNPGLLFAETRPVSGLRYEVLAPTDMVLHAIAHLFYGGEMGDALRDLVDIDVLLRHFAGGDPGFWESLWPRAEALDLASPAFYGLRYARRILGTPVPDSVLASSKSGGPSAAALTMMDRMVPAALFPQHPDHLRCGVELWRLLLYMRSHWVKMPPIMLARHLSYKLYVTRIRRAPPAQGTDLDVPGGERRERV
jgi:hypothetical protein